MQRVTGSGICKIYHLFRDVWVLVYVMEDSGTVRNRKGEWLALVIVLFILVVFPASIFAYQQLIYPASQSGMRVIDLKSQMPESGGWQPDLISVNKGERVRLRLHGYDVVHGFAIGGLPIEPVLVYPGEVATVELVAERVGEFTIYCNVWCSPYHWRMRGTLQVSDPTGQEVPAPQQSPSQKAFEALNLDVDAPHPAEAFPSERPQANLGRAFAESLGSALDPWRDRERLRNLSPSAVFKALSDGPGAGLSESDRWNLVAYLWLQTTSPERLAAGQALYQRNCAGCHGASGNGDGPGARFLKAQPPTMQDGLEGHDSRAMSREPARFRDASTMAGGRSWVYYGKIIRGGMGTGMPYWGTVFSDDEIWNIIDYLWTFLFDYGPPAAVP